MYTSRSDSFIKRYKHSLVFVVLIAVIVIGAIYQGVKWHECSQAGGEYVRDWTGFYKCVEGKEIKT